MYIQKWIIKLHNYQFATADSVAIYLWIGAFERQQASQVYPRTSCYISVIKLLLASYLTMRSAVPVGSFMRR
jgi:hypothetical protein